MATVADLQQRRDALFKALTDGIRSFKDQNGEEVAFSSGSEMRAALAALDREIANLSGGRHPSTIIFRTSKGL